ncbi:BTAD domain-containing putative transcriptional regulator [Nocardiopsis sp. NPDC058631]|uniref:AfsR/SARP family transcriptional regulator n=1 Tax=Nocardiopsis sp. NPDC058631 TaxID=3346566 RepID=UPI003647B887
MSRSDPEGRRPGSATGTSAAVAGRPADDGVRGLHVGLLGQFGVEVEGVPLSLRGDKRRAMIATLLLNAGSTVSAGHLVERVWGFPHTQANRSALQVHVARARALFDQCCGTPLIRGGNGGYRIDLAEEQSDLLRFRALVRRAAAAASAGDRETRTELLIRALGLWRGPVLADVVSPTLHARDVPFLTEELLRVAEEGFGGALARGEHERVADQIRPIATDHPEREPLIRVQMIALYRSGRPSEALRVYGRTRDALVERLGADPGRELQETFHGILRGDLDHPSERGAARPPGHDVLHDPLARIPRQRILAGGAGRVPGPGTDARRALGSADPGADPGSPDARAPSGPAGAPAGAPGHAEPLGPRTACALARDVGGSRTGADRSRGAVSEDTHADSTRTEGAPPGPVRAPASVSEPVTPAELPAVPPVLAGRDAALTELDRLVDPHGGAPGSVLVRGPAGAGSSALALRWAHSAAPHFPDGQLYVNLRDGDGSPRDPGEVLRRLARSLSSGAPSGTLGAEEAAARVRTLLARRRVLLVLDNAASSRQVRPLLPGGTGCAAVVTSRSWLTDLLVRDGLRALPVGALPPGAAVELLRSQVGVERCREAVLRRVARLAGYLPLPLRMAVAWFDTNPHVSGADLVRLLEGVDPARGVTPTARMAAVLRAGPETGRHGRGEVPAGTDTPDTSLHQESYVRLSPR